MSQLNLMEMSKEDLIKEVERLEKEVERQKNFVNIERVFNKNLRETLEDFKDRWNKIRFTIMDDSFILKVSEQVLMQHKIHCDNNGIEVR